MHLQLLNSLVSIITDPLASLFAKIWEMCELPTGMEAVNNKKGLKYNSTNYKPVSINSIYCKVMELLVCNSILAYLVQNHFLSGAQHGFVPNRSSLMNMLCVKHYILTLLDRVLRSSS